MPSLMPFALPLAHVIASQLATSNPIRCQSAGCPGGERRHQAHFPTHERHERPALEEAHELLVGVDKAPVGLSEQPT